MICYICRKEIIKDDDNCIICEKCKEASYQCSAMDNSYIEWVNSLEHQDYYNSNSNNIVNKEIEK